MRVGDADIVAEGLDVDCDRDGESETVSDRDTDLVRVVDFVWLCVIVALTSDV